MLVELLPDIGDQLVGVAQLSPVARDQVVLEELLLALLEAAILVQGVVVIVVGVEGLFLPLVCMLLLFALLSFPVTLWWVSIGAAALLGVVGREIARGLRGTYTGRYHDDR